MSDAAEALARLKTLDNPTAEARSVAESLILALAAADCPLCEPGACESGTVELEWDDEEGGLWITVQPNGDVEWWSADANWREGDPLFAAAKAWAEAEGKPFPFVP